MVDANMEPIAIVDAKSILDIFANERSPLSRTQTISKENNKNVEINILGKVSHSEIMQFFILQ